MACFLSLDGLFLPLARAERLTLKDEPIVRQFGPDILSPDGAKEFPLTDDPIVRQEDDMLYSV